MPHIHEKIDFTVEVFVVHRNKVLLRKHDKYDLWLGVGGHVELHEDPNEAAVREVKEEVGLDVTLDDSHRAPNKDFEEYSELIPPRFLNRHHISNTHEHVALIYFARSDSDKVIPERSTDVWRWLARNDIEKNILGLSDHIACYASTALRELEST